MAKRVLIYTNHFYPEQFKINEIVEWISEKECHIRVVTCIPNYPGGKYFNGYSLLKSPNSPYNSKVTINRLPLIPRGNAKPLILILNYLSYFLSCILFTIYLAIFKKKYDTIFVHHTSPILISISPIIYGFFHKSYKCIWDLDIWPETLESMNVIKIKFFNTLIKKFVSLIYDKYNTILVSSHGIKTLLESRTKSNVILFPNWADKRIEKNKIYESLELGLQNGKFIIMYTGNIGKAQNFDAIIKVVEILKHEEILWTFVGAGRYKTKFIQNINKLGLDRKCIFYDQVDVSQVPSFAEQANAMLVSLDSKGIFNKTIPAKLQSYMALGKPVIGFISGDGAEIIKKAKCGIYEENNDYIGLAKKIKIFYKKNQNELIQMGQNGKTFYFKNFSGTIRKNEILNLLKF